MSKQQTLQDERVIERFADWYARCLVDIARRRALEGRETREATNDAGRRTA